jgi:hypothetical protein
MAKTSQKLQHFAPESEELEALLGSGYGGMTRKKAELIIEERSKNPASWPYEQYENAQAFLMALKSKPRAISTRPGWTRD